jgi:hypothetical protein
LQTYSIICQRCLRKFVAPVETMEEAVAAAREKMWRIRFGDCLCPDCELAKTVEGLEAHKNG